MGNCSFLLSSYKRNLKPDDNILKELSELNKQELEDNTSIAKDNKNFKDESHSNEGQLQIVKQINFQNKENSIFEGNFLGIQINKLVLETVGLNERKLLPDVTLANGAIYIGEWKNGMRDGKGKQTWADNSIYDGNWLEDKANGFGKLLIF